jgi:hypothetical protein
MHGSTQEQRLYVTDSDAENRGKVHLLEFKKTVVTGSSKITATIVQGRFVALPLAGGGSVTCQEAANKTMIAAGTNTSTNAALIDKASLSVSAFGGFEPAETVSSIISDASGYITVNFSSGFYLLGPSGRSVSIGGGNAVIFPADNAYIP